MLPGAAAAKAAAKHGTRQHMIDNNKNIGFLHKWGQGQALLEGPARGPDTPLLPPLLQEGVKVGSLEWAACQVSH